MLGQNIPNVAVVAAVVNDESSDDNEDENHLAPPPSLYTNPDPITNTYLPEVEENPRSKFAAYKKPKRKDQDGGGKGIDSAFQSTKAKIWEHSEFVKTVLRSAIQTRDACTMCRWKIKLSTHQL